MKAKQIHLRLSSDEEIELIQRYEIFCKKKKKQKAKTGNWKRKSKNEIYKEILMQNIISELETNELVKKHNYIKDTLQEILDSQIIPRIYGMTREYNNVILTKIAMLNYKLNFLVNELGLRDLVDDTPIIENINKKINDKPWMKQIEIDEINKLQIKQRK